MECHAGIGHTEEGEALRDGEEALEALADGGHEVPHNPAGGRPRPLC